MKIKLFLHAITHYHGGFSIDAFDTKEKRDVSYMEAIILEAKEDQSFEEESFAMTRFRRALSKKDITDFFNAIDAVGFESKSTHDTVNCELEYPIPSIDGMDWGLLRQQKLDLIDILAMQDETTVTLDQENSMTGIIHLIDAIQDFAVKAGVDEATVFPDDESTIAAIREGIVDVLAGPGIGSPDNLEDIVAFTVKEIKASSGLALEDWTEEDIKAAIRLWIERK